MTAAPTMALVPGERLGCFVLGMGVNDALAILREAFLPLRPHTDVIFARERPFARDIVLRADALGLQLRFEPVSQRLRLIDVFDVCKLRLAYGGKVLDASAASSSKDAKEPSFLHLYNLFGPTYPGSVDPELDLYLLRYRGISFMFPLPDAVRDRYTGATDALPLELPDGTSPVVSRVMVFAGADERSPKTIEPLPGATAAANALLAPRSLVLSTGGASYLEEVTLQVARTAADPATAPASVEFRRTRRGFALGASAQDVLAALGQPAKIHFKRDDRMQIHAHEQRRVAGGNAARSPRPRRSGSGGTTPTRSRGASSASGGGGASPPAAAATAGAAAAAAAAHGVGANAAPLGALAAEADSCFAPSDYFWNYFEQGLDVLLDGSSHTVKKVVAHANVPGHAAFSRYNKCEFRLQAGGGGSIVTPDMRWPDVEALLGPGGRPMVHDSGAAANPFGATNLFAYEGCVLEVLRNGHIATVTLF